MTLLHTIGQAIRDALQAILLGVVRAAIVVALAALLGIAVTLALNVLTFTVAGLALLTTLLTLAQMPAVETHIVASGDFWGGIGEPTIAVDTHIFRVANRTGLAPGKTPLAVEKKLLKVVPEAYLKDAHHWLILHGRYT